MKIALIEPYIAKESSSLKKYAYKNEPAHLVGMYNLARRAGSEAEIIDAYSSRIPEENLTKKIFDGDFTHIGFTVYDIEHCLLYVQRVINNLPDDISLIIGGPGATYSTERVRHVLKPKWIIKGNGEEALYELVKKELKSGTSSETRKNNASECKILESSQLPLDEIPFTRPYDLGFYDYEASPVFQRGCVGKCIFCAGAYQDRISYMSPRKAAELLEYLISEKKASTISTLGPDFTASIDGANGIIKEFEKISSPIENFRFVVRLDTLYKCLKDNPLIWKHLCDNTNVLFETSIESFSYERLKNLGKNVDKDFVENMVKIITYILGTCDCRIILSRIALDPLIRIDEYIYDNEKYIELLKAHQHELTIGQHTIVNKFTPVRGTLSMSQAGKDNPWSKHNVFLDAKISRLNKQLLEDPNFKVWCSTAEKNDDFGERNSIFVEILQSINRVAKTMV